MDQNQSDNVNQYQYLEQLFGKLTQEQYEQIIHNSNTQNLKIGDYLFEEGDMDSCLFILLSGRLRVVKTGHSKTEILGDIGAGSVVGEFAFFTKEKRSASVYAVRNSEVLKMDEEGYKQVVKAVPQIALNLPSVILERLHTNQVQNRLGAAPKNIALLKLQRDFDIGNLGENLKEEFRNLGIESNFINEELRNKLSQNKLLEEIENNEKLNLIVCSDLDPDWAYQCVLFCDLLVLVSDFTAPPEITKIEEKINLKNSVPHKTFLLLVHENCTKKISNTNLWLQNRNIDLHLHVREDNGRDLRRFCRIATNQGIGLALSGGGAKGAAHVGAVKALMEAGIEFDFVGGSSAGALYGMGMTISDFDFHQVYNYCQWGVEKKVTSRDYHFPFISLMTGKNMRSFLHAMLGNSHLEDFFINTFCVSTNYSTAKSTVHQYGLAKQKVEGSIAIPGIFPPVIIEGQLHIDGGVLDNLPVSAMYTMPVKHVVAISLSSRSQFDTNLAELPGAWKLFMNLFKRNNKIKVPKLPSILIHSLTLNDAKKRQIVESQVDLFLELDLKEYGLLEWNKWQEIVDKGYEFTQQYLKTLPADKIFWSK